MKNIFKIVVAGVLCAAPSIAQACSCKPPPAPKIALGESAAVFVGRVTSVETRDGRNTFQFAVSKKWKGVQGDVAAVASNDNSAACGIVFDKNRDYLVYAFKIDGDDQLQTNLCTRTKRAADAADDLAELGAPKNDEPAKTSSTFTPPGRDSIRNTMQLKVSNTQKPMEVLAQAIQRNKNTRLIRVNWLTHPNSNFRGTALYDREKSTLKVYAHSHTISQIPPRTIITSALYSGVTPQIMQQLAKNPQTVDLFTGFLNFGISPQNVLAKYGVSAQDLGSRQIKD